MECASLEQYHFFIKLGGWMYQERRMRAPRELQIIEERCIHVTPHEQ